MLFRPELRSVHRNSVDRSTHTQRKQYLKVKIDTGILERKKIRGEVASDC
jgi:hypothetical protein